MDDPIQDVGPMIHKLTQGSPKEQKDTINAYFTPKASFTHPFCRTGSFEGSRYLIHAIYQWYKILSPRIELDIKSVAFDETNLLLYITIHQIFAIWIIPFHSSPVTLTTVLQLTRPPNSRKYYISSQNDLYQVDQFVKFFAPWHIGTTIVYLWHFFATAACVFGAVVLMPQTWLYQYLADRRSNSSGRESGTGEVNGSKTPKTPNSAGFDDTEVKAMFGFGAEKGGGREQYGSMQGVRYDNM